MASDTPPPFPNLPVHVAAWAVQQLFDQPELLHGITAAYAVKRGTGLTADLAFAAVLEAAGILAGFVNSYSPNAATASAGAAAANPSTLSALAALATDTNQRIIAMSLDFTKLNQELSSLKTEVAQIVTDHEAAVQAVKDAGTDQAALDAATAQLDAVNIALQGLPASVPAPVVPPAGSAATAGAGAAVAGSGDTGQAAQGTQAPAQTANPTGATSTAAPGTVTPPTSGPGVGGTTTPVAPDASGPVPVDTGAVPAGGGAAPAAGPVPTGGGA